MNGKIGIAVIGIGNRAGKAAESHDRLFQPPDCL